MKKVLLTSTALVAFAGAAAAEITFEGYAEMGVVGGANIETQFHNDIGLIIKMSSETDAGLSFGASVELVDTNSPADINGATAFDNENVWISGAFGKLTLGETDGALDWAMTEVVMGTSIADDHTTHVGYNGNGLFDGLYDNQVLRYEYSFGDFAVALSAEQDDTGVFDPTWGLGAKYSTEMGGLDLGFGLGYQSGDGFDVWGLSAKAGMDNGLTAILNYSSADFDTLADVDHYAIGLGYESGPLLVAVNYGKFDVQGGGDQDGFGVVANYDLGGGAILAAGYGSDVSTAAGDQEQYSIGLRLDF